MKAKKKDLESELIDDLLGEDPSPAESSDKTEKLNESRILPTNSPSFGNSPNFSFEKSVRTTVGRFAARTGGSQSIADSALVHSENLRIAQQKILDLEAETERLRRENEALAAAGETLRRIADETKAESESYQRKFEQMKDNYAQEREILNASVEGKDRESKELKNKIDEYEMRLTSNLQKIRVRERELENRLELVRMESTAVVRSKDEMLLDLKRRLDQAQMELENYRQKSQELHKGMGEKQELLRRTVKALRLALSMLENEVGGQDPNKR